MEWPKLVPELTVLDFEESFYFYTVVLGFEVENRRSNPDFAYLKLGDAHLMIEAYHREGWNISELQYPLGAGINFQVECENVERLVTSLAEANVKLYRSPKESWYNTGAELSGFKEFLVQDPNGYLLRFSEYLGEKKIAHP